jgi:hypothetical protein
MKRAAEERTRTLTVWRRHLWTHRGGMVCACELQPGRFRKSLRIGGCGASRCWLCHGDKLFGIPTLQLRRNAKAYEEGLWEAALHSRNQTGRFTTIFRTEGSGQETELLPRN